MAVANPSVEDRPRTAITTFILKIASRCNLACTYCYMFEGVDQSWRDLPVFMEIGTVRQVFEDIVEYGASSGLKSVSIVLHGGEPLLYPPGHLRTLFELGEGILNSAGIRPIYSVQTNGTILRPDTLELLVSNRVGIGVSMDLSDASHDTHRVDKRGRGTSQAVADGIETIRHASNLNEPSGALFVIDPTVQPREAFARIEDLGIAFVDVLLPDETWETASPEALERRYRDWLIEFFDLYVKRQRSFQIRWFQTAMKLAVGGIWGSDSLGLNSAGTVIVETNGAYQYHDVLRTAGEQVNVTGQLAGGRGLRIVQEQPTMQLMMRKSAGLPLACRGCAVVQICGGGHIAHRYSENALFNNPSVYCGAIRPLYEAVLATIGTVGS